MAFTRSHQTPRAASEPARGRYRPHVVPLFRLTGPKPDVVSGHTSRWSPVSGRGYNGGTHCDHIRAPSAARPPETTRGVNENGAHIVLTYDHRRLVSAWNFLRGAPRVCERLRLFYVGHLCLSTGAIIAAATSRCRPSVLSPSSQLHLGFYIAGQHWPRPAYTWY
jgi:hypothetical protein